MTRVLQVGSLALVLCSGCAAMDGGSGVYMGGGVYSGPAFYGYPGWPGYYGSPYFYRGQPYGFGPYPGPYFGFREPPVICGRPSTRWSGAWRYFNAAVKIMSG